MAEKYTSRGFRIYAELTDRYGSTVRVQESSLATEECVWIFCENGHPQYTKTGVAPAPHLNRDHARIVRDALTEFVGDDEMEQLRARVRALADRLGTTDPGLRDELLAVLDGPEAGGG